MNLEALHEPVKGHSSVSVRMVRDDLKAIPSFDLPDGYGIRWYESGDDAHWIRIHQESEGYGDLKSNLFFDQYGSDLELLSQRVAFVCRADGLPVSTNTAWMGGWNGQDWGRVHWVATARKEQRKGLSKPMMTVICERLCELGHERAYLTTNTMRVRAIALYAVFGFRAYWETDKERDAWVELGSRLEEIGYRVEGIPA